MKKRRKGIICTVLILFMAVGLSGSLAYAAEETVDESI